MVLGSVDGLEFAVVAEVVVVEVEVDVVVGADVLGGDRELANATIWSNGVGKLSMTRFAMVGSTKREGGIRVVELRG